MRTTLPWPVFRLMIVPVVGLAGCLPQATVPPPSSGSIREPAAQPSISERTAKPPEVPVKPSADRSAASAVPTWNQLRQICRTEGGSRNWRYIVLHHTASSRGSVESIHRAHLQRRDAAGRPWRGIGYHFVIGNGQGMPDGAIEPTFRWKEQTSGAHAGIGLYNQVGIGICLVGNFENSPPTAAQLKSVRRLVALLKARYDIGPREVIRHQDVKATACPGRMFPFDEVATAAVPAGLQLAAN